MQSLGWWYLIPLAFLGAAGRLVASLILYFVADKGEDWLFGKGRRFFGVSHKQLEGYGQRLNGTPRDYVVLFLLNAVPVIPTSLLSLTCGFIKVPIRLFVFATYFGSVVNAVVYMSIGYAGIQAAAALQRFQTASQIVGIVILLLIAGWVVYYFRKKKRGR